MFRLGDDELPHVGVPSGMKMKSTPATENPKPSANPFVSSEVSISSLCLFLWKKTTCTAIELSNDLVKYDF